MTEPVYLLTRDLLFRSKLGAVIAHAGRAASRSPADCGVAVVDLSIPDWETAVRELRAREVPVPAFGSHVDADALRRARALGAEAVPNSQVERRLSELLTH
jgi:hypothetical protein